jgi:hypothetical protein
MRSWTLRTLGILLGIALFNDIAVCEAGELYEFSPRPVYTRISPDYRWSAKKEDRPKAVEIMVTSQENIDWVVKHHGVESVSQMFDGQPTPLAKWDDVLRQCVESKVERIQIWPNKIGETVSLKRLALLGGAKSRLRQLTLFGKIDNLSVANVDPRSFSKLEFLRVGVSPTEEKVIEWAAQLPNLIGLEIDGKINDRTLQIIGQSKSLRRLACQGDVTGIGFSQWKNPGKVQHLLLRSTELSSRGTEAIKRFTNLERLTSYHSGVERQFHLLHGAFPKLRSLCLSQIEVSPAMLKCIGEFHQLEKLQLFRSGELMPGELSIGAVVDQLPKLRVLDAHPIYFHGESDIKKISQLSTLEELSIGGDHIRDGDVDELTNLVNLKDLTLASTSITDHSIELLSKLRKLERLDISGNDCITEKSINHLRKLKALKELQIRPSTLTAVGGLGTLRRMLPHCRIDGQDPITDESR